jgi:tRNA A37 threonylcarbamoyladenosine dehydratase
MTTEDDYLQRFGGVGRLFGAAALPRLRAAHVRVVGVGGVGSWVVEGLARSGVGALTLVDLDDLCVTNVNRQLPAVEGNLGRPKVEALAERVRAIYPQAQVTTVAEFFTAATADRLLEPACDWTVDCTDRMANKALLIAECVRRGQRVLTVGSAGGRRDPTRVRVADLAEAHGDELLRQVRKKLRRDHGFAKGAGQHYDVPCVSTQEQPVFPWANGTCAAEPEPGSSSSLRLDCATGFGTAVFLTGVFGLIAAGEVVRRLAQG